MPPGRDDPCPCGSGKMYIHCCWTRDNLDRIMRDLPEIPLPDSNASWEADLAAVPIRISDDETARPGLLLVTVAGRIVHADHPKRPPHDPDDVAQLLAIGIRRAAENVRVWPRRVTVRYECIAEPLRRLLADRRVGIDVASDLPRLDPALRNSREHMKGHLPRRCLLSSAPETWAGWGHPPEAIAELFAAAQSYYLAAPWQLLSGHGVLSVETAAGARWLVSAHGWAGDNLGLSMIADIRDLRSMFEMRLHYRPFPHLRGALLTLEFVHTYGVPKATRREVRLAGWPLARTAIYPRLTALNTPGGAISSSQLRDLTALLGVVPRFAALFKARLEGGDMPAPDLAWRDPDTGALIDYLGTPIPAPRVVWPAPTELARCTASGEKAEPKAALKAPADPDRFVAREAGVADRFEAWLAHRGHAPESAGALAPTARLFVEGFLAGYHGVPVRAVTEYDLRIFLYEWYGEWCAREAPGAEAEAAAVLPAMALFFQYLAEVERVDCPWADELTTDERRFMERVRSCPGHNTWDEDVGLWRQEVYPDLDARVLLSPPVLGVDDQEKPTVGVEEARLASQLQRLWLLWRDEAIDAGETKPLKVRQRLNKRHRRWMSATQYELMGLAPKDVVFFERLGVRR